MPVHLKNEMDLLGAMEVYMDARPFTSLTSTYMVSTLGESFCEHLLTVLARICAAVGISGRVQVYPPTSR
jgi:hypothetical protein